MTQEEMEIRIKALEKQTETIVNIMDRMAGVMKTMSTNLNLINEILGNNNLR